MSDNDYIINCFYNKKNYDLDDQHCWDWIHKNFINEIFPDKEMSLDDFYDHMIKNSQNYYILLGLAKGCKCGSCLDGVASFTLQENSNPKIYFRDYVKESKYNLIDSYREEIENFARSRNSNNCVQ